MIRDKTLRPIVFDRDKGVCSLCGLDTTMLLSRLGSDKPAIAMMRALGFPRAPKLWSADHVRPLWEGGDDTIDNLRTLCYPCHREVTKVQFRGRRRMVPERIAENDPQRPADLIPQRDAARIAVCNPATLRRRVASGRLTAYRETAQPFSRILYSEAECRALAPRRVR